MASFTNKTITGFRYYGSFFGENITPRLWERQVATAYATGLFTGDPVKDVSDGSIAQSAAGDPVIGVINNCEYNSSSKLIQSPYIPASTAYTPDALRSRVYLIPATPFTIFEVDADEGTTITTVAAARSLVWVNADHIFDTAGDTGTGRSGAALDISTNATTAAQWRIVNISDTPINTLASATRTKFLVVANETDNWPGTFSTTGI